MDQFYKYFLALNDWIFKKIYKHPLLKTNFKIKVKNKERDVMKNWGPKMAKSTCFLNKYHTHSKKFTWFISLL